MKLRKTRKGLVLIAFASALGLGCELIVDFDRTKIPVETTDGATPSTDGSFDSTIDTNQPDTSVIDAADAADAADAFDAFDGNDGD